MDNYSEGAIIWSRSTSKSAIFRDKPDKWFKIWFLLVERANYTTASNYMRYEWIMESTKASKDQCAKCITWMKTQGMLATTKATHGFNYKLLNYADYQNLNNYKSNSGSNSKATQKQHESSNINKNSKELTITNKEKIYKKEKSELHLKVIHECTQLGISFLSTPETFLLYQSRYSEQDIIRKAQDACTWLISKNKKRELSISRLATFLKDCKEKEQPKQYRTAQDYEQEFISRTQKQNENIGTSLPQPT